MYAIRSYYVLVGESEAVAVAVSGEADVVAALRQHLELVPQVGRDRLWRADAGERGVAMAVNLLDARRAVAQRLGEVALRGAIHRVDEDVELGLVDRVDVVELPQALDVSYNFV